MRTIIPPQIRELLCDVAATDDLSPISPDYGPQTPCEWAAIALYEAEHLERLAEQPEIGEEFQEEHRATAEDLRWLAHLLEEEGYRPVRLHFEEEGVTHDEIS